MAIMAQTIVEKQTGRCSGTWYELESGVVAPGE
jgi:hypothetical protein